MSASSLFKARSPPRYHFLDNEKQFADDGSEIYTSYTRPRTNRVAYVALSFSVILNIFLAFYSGFASHPSHVSPINGEAKKELDRSLFAGLTYDQPVDWTKGHPLESTDLKSANKTWQESIDIDPGVIALHHTYAAEHGLPRTAPFPWDDEKGLYYINGFHDLHCVKSLHMAISEFVLGAPQTYELHHITHCLNALRETVMCHAEDTPRFTLVKPWPENHPVQNRMCRSWDKLVAWARPLTACYKYVNENWKNLDSHERYKFCEEGSPYLQTVRDYWLENFDRELGF